MRNIYEKKLEDFISSSFFIFNKKEKTWLQRIKPSNEKYISKETN